MAAKITYTYFNPPQRGFSLSVLLERDVNDSTFMLTWFNDVWFWACSQWPIAQNIWGNQDKLLGVGELNSDPTSFKII